MAICKLNGEPTRANNLNYTICVFATKYISIYLYIYISIYLLYISISLYLYIIYIIYIYIYISKIIPVWWTQAIVLCDGSPTVFLTARVLYFSMTYALCDSISINCKLIIPILTPLMLIGWKISEVILLHVADK